MNNMTDHAADREERACRAALRDKKRIVVKVGSSSLLHAETGRLDYNRIDRLARELSDLKNQGKDVILVSSGAIAVGREVLQPMLGAAGGAIEHPVHGSRPIAEKQACAAVGQARLMMIYQKFFGEYNQNTAQVLMTRNTVASRLSKYNLINTFTELLRLGVIPIVNENDSVATSEVSVGDNDNLSAIVASLTGADLLVLLSDIDGLYTDDPRSDPDARFIPFVRDLSEGILQMGKGSTGSSSGTGGMSTKLHAGLIATGSGCDMVILNAARMEILHELMQGAQVGTFFRAAPSADFDLLDYVEE